MKTEHEESEQQSDFELMTSDAVASQTRAEIDVQIATAKRYPRSIKKVKDSMLSFACLDQETAENCFYKVPRGGKTVEGPSVRMAEIAVSCYGNLRVATRIVTSVAEGPNPHVVVQAVCHDLETNSAVMMEKRRRIFQKKDRDGNKLPVTEDDVNLAVNSCTAIAFRDSVFKIVPGAIIKPVFEAAKLCAIGDIKTIADRRQKMVDHFGKMGIVKERIFAAVGVKAIDEIGVEQLETLIGINTAVRNNEINIDVAFPEIKKPEATVSQGFTPTVVAAPETEDQKQKRTRRTKEQMAAARAAETAGTPDTSNADLNPQPVTTPGAPTPTDLEQLAKKMDDNHITTAALHKVLVAMDFLKDESLTSLKEINDVEPTAIEQALKHWDALLPNLKIA